MPPSSPATWRARVERLGCAPLVDAMGRVHQHRAHLPALRSPTPSRPLFGPAVTIQYLPTRDDLAGRDFAAVLAEAVDGTADGAAEGTGEGSVLVMGSGGYPDVSHGGGVKLARAARQGLSGVLADGLLRDFAELADLGLPVWCRGEAVRWGGDSVMPYAANVAVEVAGVTVVRGDVLYVDAAGGVVIPSGSLARVVEEAESIAAEDEAALARIRAEGG